MSIRMTRRELALAAAAGMGSASAQEAEKTYGGALEGANVDAKTFDPVAWTMQRHDSAPLKLTFKAIHAETNRSVAKTVARESCGVDRRVAGDRWSFEGADA